MLHIEFGSNSNKFHSNLFNVFEVIYVINELIGSFLEAILKTIFSLEMISKEISEHFL